MKPDEPTGAPSPGLPDASAQKPSGLVRRPPQPRTAAEIREWFATSLARITDISPDEIDETAPFESFGLDSVTAVGLTGELEEWLGSTVDPMAVYDYPTIEALAKHLAEVSATQGAS